MKCVVDSRRRQDWIVKTGVVMMMMMMMRLGRFFHHIYTREHRYRMRFHEPIPKWILLDTAQSGETVPGQWYIDRRSRPPGWEAQ